MLLNVERAISYSHDALDQSWIDILYIPLSEKITNGYKAFGQLLWQELAHRNYEQAISTLLSSTDPMWDLARLIDKTVQKLGYRETAHALQELSKGRRSGKNKVYYEWGRMVGRMENNKLLKELIKEAQDNKNEIRRIIDLYIK